jgi:Tol biopolymer transport system component
MFFTTGTWPNSIIMHVKENGDKWGKPEPATFLKNDWATQPAFSPDGQFLYFSSSRKETDIRLYSIWRCKKIANGWSEPENVINMEGDLIMLFHPSIDSSGSVYFLRFDYPNQTGDLYVAKASGDMLSDPVKLDSPISTEFNEVRPTVDPQGRYLLYVSDRPDGFGGKDVYVCHRNPDGTWSVPQNLGSELNTPGNDDVPTISPDATYWFFEKDGNIYWRESPLNPR